MNSFRHAALQYIHAALGRTVKHRDTLATLLDRAENGYSLQDLAGPYLWSMRRIEDEI